MDVKLLSDDGRVLRLSLEQSIVPERTTPDSRPFERMLGAGGYSRRVLLSLAKMALVDSVRLGWFATLQKRFCDAGGKLVIHSVRPEVMEVLETARFELLFHIAEDEAAALKMVQDDS
jgi:anti-anti-sigma regulatory factor